MPDGDLLYLTQLAHEISSRFFDEHPDEAERYGEAGFAWCVHDNQWLLAWAVEDLEIGGGHFVRNVRWLARVLGAREYPLELLARDLEIAADAIGDASGSRAELSRRLLEGARAVRRLS